MKKLVLLVLCAMSALLCSSHGNKENEVRVLRMGTSLDYPPFEFIKKGEAAGMDIDIANELVRRLGYDLKIENMEFSGLIGALKAGRVDFVMAGMQANETRRKNVDFSEEYMEEDDLALIFMEGHEIDNAEGMAGKRIGAQLGSVMELYLKEKKEELEGLSIVAIGNNLVLIEDLKVGRLDAVLLRQMQAQEFARANKGISYQVLPGTHQGVAIAFRKGSEWVERFNAVLKEMKREGTIQAIKERWLK